MKLKINNKNIGEIKLKAKGTYGVKKWEENVYEQISSEMKMTKASVEYSMTERLMVSVLWNI